MKQATYKKLQLLQKMVRRVQGQLRERGQRITIGINWEVRPGWVVFPMQLDTKAHRYTQNAQISLWTIRLTPDEKMESFVHELVEGAFQQNNLSDEALKARQGLL